MKCGWHSFLGVDPHGMASDDLARAMMYLGLDGTWVHEVPPLENRDLRALAEAVRRQATPRPSSTR